MVENFLKTDTKLEMQEAQRLQSNVKIKKINKKHKNPTKFTNRHIIFKL